MKSQNSSCFALTISTYFALFLSTLTAADDVNQGQFIRFSTVNCNGTAAVCAESPPDESIDVISAGQCVGECNRRQQGAKPCVGVNYRQQPKKVCEVYSNGSIEFRRNVKECHYMKRETASGINCTTVLDVNDCPHKNNCSSNALCKKTTDGYNCTCKPLYTGDGITCNACASWQTQACAGNRIQYGTSTLEECLAYCYSVKSCVMAAYTSDNGLCYYHYSSSTISILPSCTAYWLTRLC